MYKRTMKPFACIEPIPCAVLLIVLASGMGGPLLAQEPVPEFLKTLPNHERGRSDSWTLAGGNLENTHSSFSEQHLGPHNVSGMTPKWIFTTEGDVSATPTVEGDGLYVPDWGGNLFKINARTGNVIWQHKMSDYTGNATSWSRTSPAIAPGMVVVGDQSSGTVMAIDK